MTPTDLDALLREATPLVERLRSNAGNLRILGRRWEPLASDYAQAADTIEALRAKCEETARLHALACARLAEYNRDLQAAEARLAEIGEIAGAPVLTAGGDPRDRSLPSRLRDRLDRIATLAKGS